jgi:DMSO/TMAO reductase YedYZ molybdopterin-dependent catalytic subunit
MGLIPEDWMKQASINGRRDAGGRTSIRIGGSDLRSGRARGATFPFVMAFCDGGYTTNLPVEDLLEGKALVVWEYDGEPLGPEHGGPARLLVPHLYFWKSAKWVRGLRFMEDNEPGFWEVNGYHNYGDPSREQRYDGD